MTSKIQALPPLQLTYLWRVHGDVADVVPSRAAFRWGIAFVWASAFFPVVVCLFFPVEGWFVVLGVVVATLVASLLTWFFQREYARTPLFSIDMRAGVLRTSDTTVPLKEVQQVRVVQEVSAESTAEQNSVSTIYVVLSDNREQAIAAFLWRGAAFDLGRKTAEKIGVPFVV
jgi:hypothetical protein